MALTGSVVNNHYGIGPIDLSGLKTISLAERGGKVKQTDFAQVYTNLAQA